MLVLASLRFRDVVDYRNKIIVKSLNNEVIRENGLTARNTIISDTAQRIAVHRPDKNRFASFGGFDSGIPEIMTPADFSPLLFPGIFGQPIENGFEIVELDFLASQRSEISRSNLGFAFRASLQPGIGRPRARARLHRWSRGRLSSHKVQWGDSEKYHDSAQNASTVCEEKMAKHALN